MKFLTHSLALIFVFMCSVSVAQNHDDYLKQSITTDKTFQELSEIGENYYKENGTQRGIGYKPFKRWQEWSRRNLDENGRIISNAEAAKEFKKFKEQDQINRSVSGPFTEMGPLSAVNTSTWSSHIGRLTNIDVHDSNENHILVCSPGGGVWHSFDLGVTWAPIYDQEADLEVLCVNINHANANDYVVGTAGSGIFRSTDQGVTWTASSGPTNDWFIDIKRHPTDATIMFATGRFFGQTWRSADSGDSWVVVDDQSSDVHDLDFKPGDPSTIYISGNGFIRRSTDTGVSFSDLTSGGTWGTSSSNTIMLAVSPAAPDDLFVLEEQGGGFQGLYKSTNSGNSFSTIITFDGTNNVMGYDLTVQDGQGPRDMDIAVSPTDTDIIHVAGTECYKSTDGGLTFTRSGTWNLNNSDPFIHADIDQLIYHGDRFFSATDGGLFYSDDDATSWVDRSQGLGIRQFYRIGASQTEVDRVGGGSQDNGTGVVKSGVWHDWLGADGMETFIDWSNAEITYGNVQFGSLYKSINGGTTNIFTTQTPGGQGAWITPTEQDPVDPNTVYQAKFDVYKSTDGADSWDPISDFDNGLIFEMKIAPSDNQTIYIAFSHDIYKTTDGGTSWTDVTPTIAFGDATYIAIHPTDPNRVSLTISGASEKIVESTDGGSTWVDISSNLPAIGSQCVAYENDSEDAMYVGMNPGLYFKDNTTGGTWSLVNAAMPNVSVTEVEPRNGILYIATYGRGLWKVDLLEMPVPENCATPELVIPDGDIAGVSTTINLNEIGTITDVNIDLEITHAWMGDVQATLTHGGVSVVLFDRPGVPASGFGCGQGNMDCTFDDESINGPIEDLCDIADPTYAGDYNPADPLSAFIGMEASGDWVLSLSDAETQDEGILDGWCIDIEIENNCNDAVVDIPDDDPAGVVSVVELGVGGFITDVNVEIDIAHTYVGDLVAILRHVDTGTEVELFNQPGVPGSTFGCGDDDINCTFDDESTNGTVEGVCNGTTPAYSGDYNPEQLLSAFNGEDRAGTWELVVSDVAGGLVGSIQSWCLIIESGDCPPDYAGANKLNDMLTTDESYFTSGDLESSQELVGPINVLYSAEGDVELQNGFSTEAATEFEISNEGCPE